MVHVFVDTTSPPEASPVAATLTFIEDDELLEEDASESLEQEEDPDFDPDLFLWKKSSLVNNELDFSSGNLTVLMSCCLQDIAELFIQLRHQFRFLHVFHAASLEIKTDTQEDSNNNNCDLDQLGSLEETQNDVCILFSCQKHRYLNE